MKDLMSPRFKVIADYPGSVYSVGRILRQELPGYYEKYPHLFKPLPWHEDREPGDMPEYVKRIKNDFSVSYVGIPIGGTDRVKIVRSENGDYGMETTDGDENRIIMRDLDCFTPATLEDYNNYINSKA